MTSSDWIIIPTSGENKNVPNHQRVDQCNDHPNISTYQLCCQVKIVDGFQLGQYYVDPRFNPKLAIIICSFLFILSMPYSTSRNDRTTIHHFSEKSTCLSFLKACHLNVFILSISPLPPGARLAKTPAEALRSCRRCVWIWRMPRRRPQRENMSCKRDVVSNISWGYYRDMIRSPPHYILIHNWININI